MQPLRRKIRKESGASETHCRVCSRPFGFLNFRSKHECRVCLSLVCEECSQHRVPVEGLEGPSRVCDVCMVEEEDRLLASKRQGDSDRRGSGAAERMDTDSQCVKLDGAEQQQDKPGSPDAVDDALALCLGEGKQEIGQASYVEVDAVSGLLAAVAVSPSSIEESGSDTPLMTPKDLALAELADPLSRGTINEDESNTKKALIDQEPEQCPICLDELDAGKGVALFKIECGHEFHFECIKDNTAGAGKNASKCPICRHKMEFLPCAIPCRHSIALAAAAGGVPPNFCPDCGLSLSTLAAEGSDAAFRVERQVLWMSQMRQQRLAAMGQLNLSQAVAGNVGGAGGDGTLTARRGLPPPYLQVQCPRCRMQSVPGSHCVNCSAPLPSASDAAGAVVRCPTCQLHIRIPGPVSPHATYRCPSGHHFQIMSRRAGGAVTSGDMNPL